MSGFYRTFVAIVLVGCCTIGVAKTEQEALIEKIRALGWQRGPTQSALGTKATLKLPDGASILPEVDSNKFLQLTGNLPSPGTNIVAANSCWATFEFDPAGYIKDDEKIDADDLLKSIKASDGPANEERRKQGYPELTTEGWYVPPHYDEKTKYLEWGLRLKASNDPTPVINYTVRILGRTGYERVVLVSSPNNLDNDVKEFKALLKSFSFNSGEAYTEFKQGDRIAEYGLAALVAGGAAAVIDRGRRVISGGRRGHAAGDDHFDRTGHLSPWALGCAHREPGDESRGGQQRIRRIPQV